MKTISDIQKEFEKRFVFFEYGSITDDKETMVDALEFIQSSIQELLESVVPETKAEEYIPRLKEVKVHYFVLGRISAINEMRENIERATK